MIRVWQIARPYRTLRGNSTLGRVDPEEMAMSEGERTDPAGGIVVRERALRAARRWREAEALLADARRCWPADERILID